MNAENDQPFLDYLNAVDARLEARTGELTEQRDIDAVAACQEAGDSPEDCARELVRRIRIRALNDALRARVGFVFCGNAPGRIFITRGIAALSPPEQAQIAARVRDFDDFSEDNDPHGEHDFGAFDFDGRRIFWKIDYYDPSLERGSEDPADPQKTTRVLTVLLAEEW
jgi:hypothetical protein